MKTQIISKQNNTLKFLFLISIMMLMATFANPALAQNDEHTVSGVVKSMDGPVSGASIVLKGTSIWATSDDDGFFTFPQTLKVNDILVITSLGYYDQEVVIAQDGQYIEPFMEDVNVVIVGALRTSKSNPDQGNNQ